MLAVCMASVHKRPGSKYWYAAWRDADGHLYLRSTKQRERQKALIFALQMEHASRMESLTEGQARNILGNLLERLGEGEKLRNPSIDEWLLEWLKSKEISNSESTMERYRGVVNTFIKHLGQRAKRPLNALTTRDVQAFLTARQKSGCSPTTVSLDAKIIRTPLNAARRQGLISNNPAEGVELPDPEPVERGTFNGSEVQLLVDVAQDDWKALILLGYYTGQRLSDLCGLRWDEVDLAKGVMTFSIQKTKQKRHVLPIHPDLQLHLERLASSDMPQEFLLPHMALLGTGGRHGLSEGFKRIVIKAGLDLQTVQGGGKRKISRRTFHALRHSFTSALANAGVAPEIRMKLTGHKSAVVHRGYTHHELAVLRNELEKLPTAK